MKFNVDSLKVLYIMALAVERTAEVKHDRRAKYADANRAKSKGHKLLLSLCPFDSALLQY